MKAGQIMETLNISSSTLYNYVFARNSLNDSKESHQIRNERMD